MPVTLLKNATKQLHQSFRAVKQRVSVGRSNSFEGLSRGTSFSSVSSPGWQTPSSGTPSCRRSILEDVSLDFPVVEEASSRDLERPLGPSSTPWRNRVLPLDNSSHSGRLHSFMHKFSSFGSASGFGDTSESSSVSGVFRHQRQKSDSGTMNLWRKMSYNPSLERSHVLRGLDLHDGIFRKHRSESSGKMAERQLDDELEQKSIRTLLSERFTKDR